MEVVINVVMAVHYSRNVHYDYVDVLIENMVKESFALVFVVLMDVDIIIVLVQEGVDEGIGENVYLCTRIIMSVFRTITREN